jgi:hypothetical protein
MQRSAVLTLPDLTHLRCVTLLHSMWGTRPEHLSLSSLQPEPLTVLFSLFEV